MKKEIKKRIEMINKGEVPQGYKETKLGIIPGEWKIKEMGKFFVFKNGINASKEKYGSGVKFINTLEVLNNNSISYSDIKGSVVISDKKFKKNSVQKGDILFNRTSETADEIAKSAVYLGDKEVTFGGFIIRATERKDEFDINYKKYAFNSSLIRREFKKRGQGISRINIGQNELGNVPIILLSKNEQAKIANILTTWDEAIDLKEKLLEKKKDIKKGLMQRLLTGKIRLDGFDDEWMQFRIGDICALITGKRPKGGVSEEGDIPSLGGENIKKEYGMKYDSIKMVSKEFADKMKKGILKNNDILLNKDGASTGKLGLYKKIFEFATINEHLYIIRTHNKSNVFLFYKLCTDHIQNRLEALITGAAQPGLNQKSFNSLKLEIPTDINEQKAIADILSKADKSIELLEKEIELLREQKKGLMQLLLTGKVRVNELN